MDYSFFTFLLSFFDCFCSWRNILNWIHDIWGKEARCNLLRSSVSKFCRCRAEYHSWVPRMCWLLRFYQTLNEIWKQSRCLGVNLWKDLITIFYKVTVEQKKTWVCLLIIANCNKDFDKMYSSIAVEIPFFSAIKLIIDSFSVTSLTSNYGNFNSLQKLPRWKMFQASSAWCLVTFLFVGMSSSSNS